MRDSTEPEKAESGKAEPRKAVRYSPNIDTGAAFVTFALMIVVYYLNAHYGYRQPAIFFGVFVGIGHLLLNTAIPALFVFYVRKEDWSGLGITKKRAILSIAISAGLAALMFPELQRTLTSFNGNPAPHIIYNGISLWEPLFVYGWLQIRFERAFGYLIAPILAGACFAAYHIGSVPQETLITLFVFGVIYGVIFALVENLLVLIPATWAVSSSIGTIQSGFSFDWTTVVIYSVVLAIQIAILVGIYLAARNRQQRFPAPGHT